MTRSLVHRLLVVTLAGLTLAGSSYVGLAAKPTPPPPPPLPPVRYEIQFFDTPHQPGAKSMNDMNNLGQCVGYYEDAAFVKRAYLYDPAVDPQTARDLSTIAPAPAGWVLASAVGVNDHGVIVGYLEPEGSPWDQDVRVGFVLDTAAETPVVTPLPDGAWDFSYPRRINENGEILGLYRNTDGTWGPYLYNLADSDLLDLGVVINPGYIGLNNPTDAHDVQIAGIRGDGSVFRWTRGSGFETLLPAGSPGPGAYDINDSGTVCGWAQIKLSKTRYQQRPMRFTSSLEVLPGGYYSASGINAQGDVTLGEGLYTDGWGTIRVDDLIDKTDPDAAKWFSPDRAFFNAKQISDRIAGPDFPGFGAVVAYSNLPARLCLLTPVAINP